MGRHLWVAFAAAAVWSVSPVAGGLAALAHEAGHALVAVLAGGEVHELSLLADGGGRTRVDGAPIPLVLMGGPVAGVVVWSAAFEAITRLRGGWAPRVVAVAAWIVAARGLLDPAWSGLSGDPARSDLRRWAEIVGAPPALVVTGWMVAGGGLLVWRARRYRARISQVSPKGP